MDILPIIMSLLSILNFYFKINLNTLIVTKKMYMYHVLSLKTRVKKKTLHLKSIKKFSNQPHPILTGIQKFDYILFFPIFLDLISYFFLRIISFKHFLQVLKIHYRSKQSMEI